MHLVLNMFIFTRTLVTYARTIFKPREAAYVNGYESYTIQVPLSSASAAVIEN